MENLKKKIQEVVNLYQSQKFILAEQKAKSILINNSKIGFLYNLLGLILVGQTKYNDAIKYYQKGIEIEPNNAMIYNNLGAVYKTKNKHTLAENYYNKSIQLDNKIPETQNNIGNLYIELNKYDDAINSFKKAININSEFYIAYYNLGILHKSLGNLKESKKYFEKTIEKKPDFYSAHRAYSQVNNYTDNHDHIKLMEDIYSKKNINVSGKISLSFALGKAFDDTQKYKKAVKYYNEGNKLRKKNIKFLINDEKKEFNSIKKLFSKTFLKNSLNIKNENISPIFILGMPRSGTSLVEQIISTHSKVHGGGELNYFNELIKFYFYKDNKFNSNMNGNDIIEIFNNINKNYLEKLFEISKKKFIITDKLPINFKWIGFIKLIFPRSKVIHCTRNPKDNCLSIYKNYFTNIELNYAYNFNELVNFYNLYKDLMKFWNFNIPNFIYDIKYENLVNNHDHEIKKLIKNCGLNWEDSCLEFYKNRRIVKTASDTQVRNKIYKKSIHSWKNYEQYFKKDFDKLIVS